MAKQNDYAQVTQTSVDVSLMIRQLDQAKRSLVGYQKTAKEGFVEPTNQMSESAKTATKAVGDMNDAVNRLAGMAAFSHIKMYTQHLTDFSQSLIQSATAMQTFSVQYNTLLGPGLGSSTLSKLQQMAISTPFEYMQIVEAGQQFAGIWSHLPRSQLSNEKYGITGAVTAAGELSAATGFSLDETMRALTRMRIPGMNWRRTVAGQFISGQLAGAGIDTSQGGETLYRAAIDVIMDRFGGMMEKQMGTLAQAISNLNDSIQDVLVNAGRIPMVPAGGSVAALRGAASLAGLPGVRDLIGVAGTIGGAVGLVGAGIGTVGLGQLTFAQAAQYLGRDIPGWAGGPAGFRGTPSLGHWAMDRFPQMTGGMLGYGLGGAAGYAIGDMFGGDTARTVGAMAGGGLGAYYGYMAAPYVMEYARGRWQQFNEIRGDRVARTERMLNRWFGYTSTSTAPIAEPVEAPEEPIGEIGKPRAEAIPVARPASQVRRGAAIHNMALGAGTAAALWTTFWPIAAVTAGVGIISYIGEKSQERKQETYNTLTSTQQYEDVMGRVARSEAGLGEKDPAAEKMLWDMTLESSGGDPMAAVGTYNDLVKKDIDQKAGAMKAAAKAEKMLSRERAFWGYRSDTDKLGSALDARTSIAAMTATEMPDSLLAQRVAGISLAESKTLRKDAVAEFRKELVKAGASGLPSNFYDPNFSGEGIGGDLALIDAEGRRISPYDSATGMMNQEWLNLSAEMIGKVESPTDQETLTEARKKVIEAYEQETKDTRSSADIARQASAQRAAAGVARLDIAGSAASMYGIDMSGWAASGASASLQHWSAEVRRLSAYPNSSEYMNAVNQLQSAQMMSSRAAVMGKETGAMMGEARYSAAIAPYSGMSSKDITMLGRSAIQSQLGLAQAYKEQGPGMMPYYYQATMHAGQMTDDFRKVRMNRDMASATSGILEGRLGRATEFLEKPSLAIRSARAEAEAQLNTLRQYRSEAKAAGPEQYVEHIANEVALESQIAQFKVQESQATHGEDYADNITKVLEKRPVGRTASQQVVDSYKDAQREYNYLASMKDLSGLTPDQKVARAKSMYAARDTMARSRGRYAMAYGAEYAMGEGLTAMRGWRPDMSQAEQLNFNLQMVNAQLGGAQAAAAIGGLDLNQSYQNQQIINQSLKDRYGIMKDMAALPFDEKIDRMRQSLAYFTARGADIKTTGRLEDNILDQMLRKYYTLQAMGVPTTDPDMVSMSTIIAEGQGLASMRPFLSARRDASVYGAQASAERAWLSLQPGMESAMASGALPPHLRALYTQQYQSLEKAYRLTEDPMQKAETRELGAQIMQLLKGKPSGEWAGTYMGKLINLSQGRAAGSMLDLARQGVVLGVSKSQHEITLKIGFDNIPAFLNESYIGQLVNQAVYNILSNAGSRGTQTRR